MDNGQPVKMSKRAGTFVTVRDVIDSVGADVIRFIMLTRRSEQTRISTSRVRQSRDNHLLCPVRPCSRLFRSASGG